MTKVTLTNFSNRDSKTISDIIYDTLCDKGIPFDTDHNSFAYKIVVHIEDDVFFRGKGEE